MADEGVGGSKGLVDRFLNTIEVVARGM